MFSAGEDHLPPRSKLLSKCSQWSVFQMASAPFPVLLIQQGLQTESRKSGPTPSVFVSKSERHSFLALSFLVLMAP